MLCQSIMLFAKIMSTLLSYLLIWAQSMPQTFCKMRSYHLLLRLHLINYAADIALVSSSLL